MICMVSRSTFRIFSLLLASAGLAASAYGQPNCNTMLSRVARAAAEKAIAERKDTACSDLKKGPIAIDKTKTLELTSFKLCEDGPIVSADVAVKIKCATSDAALIHASIEDTATASVSADLDTCRVLRANVTAEGFVAQAGINIADLNGKLKEAAEKEIKPYCKK
jgi:hypothetical protein